MAGRRPLTCRRRDLLLAACLTTPFGARPAAPEPGGAGTPPRPIRLALSASTLGDVNEADARAALKVWIQNATQGTAVRLELAPAVFVPSDEMERQIRRGDLDAFVITALEYVRVAEFVSPDWLLVDANSREESEYLLLVHAKSGITRVQQLKGVSLAIHQNKAASLALVWVSTLLASQRLDPPERFFGRTVFNTKLARVLLPVFFRQVDACVVRRSGYRTMCDLNPQLGRQLRVVATSPHLITELFGLHKHCPSPESETFKNALMNLRNTSFGKQVTTLFQSGAFVPETDSCMREVLELVAAYDRIRARSGREAAGAPRGSSGGRPVK